MTGVVFRMDDDPVDETPRTFDASVAYSGADRVAARSSTFAPVARRQVRGEDRRIDLSIGGEALLERRLLALKLSSSQALKLMEPGEQHRRAMAIRDGHDELLDLPGELGQRLPAGLQAVALAGF